MKRSFHNLPRRQTEEHLGGWGQEGRGRRRQGAAGCPVQSGDLSREVGSSLGSQDRVEGRVLRAAQGVSGGCPTLRNSRKTAPQEWLVEQDGPIQVSLSGSQARGFAESFSLSASVFLQQINILPPRAGSGIQ